MNKNEKLYALEDCILEMGMTQRRMSSASKILRGASIVGHDIKELAQEDTRVHEAFSKYEKTAQKVEREFLECLQEFLEIKQSYLVEEGNI
jgi:hypothetical protein